MTLSLPMRMLCTFAMLFPIGMLMGTFFPSGLQFVRERSERYLPWAWGINGCCSVYGSFAAILMAIYHGFYYDTFSRNCYLCNRICFCGQRLPKVGNAQTLSYAQRSSL